MNKSKIVILISGNGTNLQAIIDAVESRCLDAEIACVISNNPDAYGLERARKHGIDCRVIPYEILSRGDKHRQFHRSGQACLSTTRQDFERELLNSVKFHNPGLIVLAGFMLILSEEFINAFPDKIINLHPAILPDNPSEDEITLPDGTKSKVFRGTHALRDAWDASVTYTGCTVHKVTPSVDRGDVVARVYVKIDRAANFDSLQKLVQQEEHRIIVEAVKLEFKKQRVAAGMQPTK